jgi:hypothetical protein
MRGGRLVVSLWGRPWRRDELLARVGRLEQVAGVRLVEGGDGAERGVHLLRCSTGAGFEFEILVDRGFDVGGAWLGGRPLAWASPALDGRDAIETFAAGARELAAAPAPAAPASAGTASAGTA